MLRVAAPIPGWPNWGVRWLVARSPYAYVRWKPVDDCLLRPLSPIYPNAVRIPYLISTHVPTVYCFATARLTVLEPDPGSSYPSATGLCRLYKLLIQPERSTRLIRTLHSWTDIVSDLARGDRQVICSIVLFLEQESFFCSARHLRVSNVR